MANFPVKLFTAAHRFFERHPLAVSLVLAAIIRTAAALRNYGPFAVDDYQNVIEPALRYLELGTKPDIPTLRFEILPYTFALFMKPLYALGLKRADYLVSFAYFVMGLISLTQIYAVHKIGGYLLQARWQNAMTLFTATWAIAPIFTNSADIAGPAHILLTFSILYLIRSLPEAFGVMRDHEEKTTIAPIAWSGFYLSAAIFFRFSLAPLYFALSVWLLLKTAQGKRIRNLLLFAAGGFFTAVLMVCVELVSRKVPFSTAIEFLKYNFGAHIETQSYGNMPWHMYLVIFAIFPLPILSFFFWRPMFQAARRYSALVVLLVTFTVSHSAIAFKLERYVIPLLPIMIIFLFKGIELYAHSRIVKMAYKTLIFLNLVLIVPVVMTMQQRAGVDGAIYLGGLKGAKFAHRIDPWRQGYYGFRQRTPFMTTKPEEIVEKAKSEKLSAFHVLRFMYFSRLEIQQMADTGYQCWQKRIFEPDFLEKVSIRLNPAMNFRRSDTVVYYCEAVKRPQ
jgi:hypothetical protein